MKKALKVLAGVLFVAGLFVVAQNIGVQEQATEIGTFMYDPGGGGR